MEMDPAKLADSLVDYVDGHKLALKALGVAALMGLIWLVL